MPFAEIPLLAWWGSQNHHYCNIDQYRMLKRCSDAKDMQEWNDWRRQNPHIEVYLQGADLKGFFLEGADLNRANFQGANCLRTDFQGANCKKANFTMANCQLAYFDHADCREVNFFNTNCQAASFRYSKCQQAFFFDAKCQATYFHYAHCQETNFVSANCLSADFLHANCQAAKFWGVNCQSANFTNANCEGADFGSTHCHAALFDGANCQSVDFTKADCHVAHFVETHCEKAKFQDSKCQGSYFIAAKLKGTLFHGAIFSRETRFADCSIDDQTDCTRSNLALATIESGVRAKLERNARKLYWKKWYEPAEVTKVPENSHKEEKSGWYSQLKQKAWYQKLVTAPVRGFWWISDYGYNTKRLLGVLLASALFFASVYTLFPSLLKLNVAEMSFINMLVFSTSNMISLGFNISRIGIGSVFGMFVVVLNFFVGYVVLAAFMLRLNVFLQNKHSRVLIPTEKRKLPDSL